MINEYLLKALLAMDLYNRGYLSGVVLPASVGCDAHSRDVDYGFSIGASVADAQQA